MANVTVSKQLPAAADAVWEIVGGWNTLPAWHPAVVASEGAGDGLLRRVRLADGTEITERLEHFDRAARTYTYVIIESPLPLSRYRSTIRVETFADGARVDWSTEFEVQGVPEGDLATLLHEFYTAGLEAVQGLLRNASA